MQRRLFSSSGAAVKTLNQHKWSIKQVNRSNFKETLEEFKTSIDSSDFLAVSLQNTGGYAASWHRVSAFDTPQTAYLKTKYAAERFQIFQFAVCPFSIRSSELTAHPYNFHLFPRDELRLGMPSYSFSCQATRLTSMAREGFDFNNCIYEGISYLSRAQESVAKLHTGTPILAPPVTDSSSPSSVSDSIFIGRIKSRVKNWKQACTDSNSNKEDSLLSSMRKLILGSELYGSRPCFTIDVCSERQVQLVLEMLAESSDVLVPLLTPSKSGGTQAVRVVLASSKEDADLVRKEFQDFEAEQKRRVRGFREVIDLISESRKPVISENSLIDFSFVHSKFLAPLPPSFDEFITSLDSVFPYIVDINHLLRETSPLKKVTRAPAALSYLKNRFFAPFNLEVANQDETNDGNTHGRNVLMLCQLFAKLCSVSKLDTQSGENFKASVFDKYTNVLDLNAGCLQEPPDEDVKVWTNNARKVSSENLIFVWGLGHKITAGVLKTRLRGSHEVFSEEFDVKFVDRSCAIVVFWNPGLSETFLNAVNSEEQLSGSLKEIVADGLRAAGYESYRTACRLGFWEADLADSLDKALEFADFEPDSETKPSEIYWTSESAINFDEL